MIDQQAMVPRRAEAVDLPPGDYVARGFWVIRPDQAFPHMRLGDPRRTTWPYMRREGGHNWYVDDRHPSVGFVNRDEASILYNTARLFVGRRCLEIGCWRGWSTAHLAAGCGGLEVIDPVLADDDWRADVEGSLARAGVQDQVKLFPLASPQGLIELAARDPTPWSLIFIDGDHEAGGPRRDAEMSTRYAAEDAIILLHDLLSPAVADALGFLRGQGWRTMIYNTAQIVGVAWRGAAEPLAHVPDSHEAWRIPAHLSSFLVSGEGAEARAERLRGVIEGLAEGAEHPGLGSDPTELRLAAEKLQALTIRNEELRDDLKSLREQSKRLSDHIADLSAERDSYFAYYSSHNEARAALAERETQLERLREQEAAARETILARVQVLEQQLESERCLKTQAAAELQWHQDLAGERGRRLDEALQQIEQLRSTSAAGDIAVAQAVQERARLRKLAGGLQRRLEHLDAQRRHAEAQAEEVARIASEQAEHLFAELDQSRERLAAHLEVTDRETEMRARLEDEVKSLEERLKALSLPVDGDQLDQTDDVSVLSMELTRVKAELDKSRGQVAEFDSRIISLEHEMAESIIHISWLEQERDQITAERDRIEGKLNAALLQPASGSRLSVPAVTDADIDRLSSAWAEAEVERDRFRAELDQAKADLWTQVLASRAEAEDLRRENEAIKRSEAWRMTAPLRALMQMARGSRSRG